MPAQWYEVLAMVMRYWFALLAALTLYRALRWLMTDSSLRRKAMRALPDAGYIGHFLVLSGESRALSGGDELQLPCEGTLGYSRRCDVCVRHKSLFPREAFFWLEHDGLHMSPIHSGSFSVDGQQVGAGDEAILLSGARLLIGEVALELKLLKGLPLGDAFDAPPEPYVTPERRRRAQRAGQEKRTKKRSGASDPAPRKSRRSADASDAPASSAPSRRARPASAAPTADAARKTPASSPTAARRPKTANAGGPRAAKRRLSPPED